MPHTSQSDYILSKISKYGKLQQWNKHMNEKVNSEDFDWIDVYKMMGVKQEHLNSSTNKTQVISRMPIIFFLISALICLLNSSIYHTFNSLSSGANKYLLRLDYSGVNFLIFGTTIPLNYYGFFCQMRFASVYIWINGITCLTVFIMSIFSFFHSQKFRTIKSIIFGGIGIFAALPLFHLGYYHIIRNSENGYLDISSTFIFYIIMFFTKGFFYLFGLTIYNTRIPERYNPGKYDIWGSSHQIWHICIVIAIIVSYFGCLNIFYLRQNQPCLNCSN